MMRAFVDTKVTKATLLAALECHAAADRIIQGFYWKDGRGCGVGCTLHNFAPGREDEHALYEELFGVPQVLARLKDRIHEGLPPAEAKGWPLQFARAIPEGADLSRVVPSYMIMLLVDPTHGAVAFAARQPKAVREIQAVADLYRRTFAGETVGDGEWASRAEATWAAARASWALRAPASWAALRVAGMAERVSWVASASAVEAEAEAATWAADAAADAAAAAAAKAELAAVRTRTEMARCRHFSWQASRLAQLLSEVPPQGA